MGVPFTPSPLTGFLPHCCLLVALPRSSAFGRQQAQAGHGRQEMAKCFLEACVTWLPGRGKNIPFILARVRVHLLQEESGGSHRVPCESEESLLGWVPLPFQGKGLGPGIRHRGQDSGCFVKPQAVLQEGPLILGSPKSNALLSISPFRAFHARIT